MGFGFGGDNTLVAAAALVERYHRLSVVLAAAGQQGRVEIVTILLVGFQIPPIRKDDGDDHILLLAHASTNDEELQ
jgi:hypothetical protein